MLDAGYEILSGNTVVAEWVDGDLTILNAELLPLFFGYRPDLPAWLSTRAIDPHRANSRLLKKALRLSERDNVSTSLRAHGLTITDNYWARECGSSLRYEDVRFDEAYYRKAASRSAAKLALSGSSKSFGVVAESRTDCVAELTNIGSFEKCWKNIDGKWWMFKVANRGECFSEVFICQLCAVLGISCAVYEKHGAYVRTLDFADGDYNFEPALAFMGDEEDYGKTIEKLKELCPAAVPDYVRMIFLDALVFNPDRHTANFGLLRDKKTGALVGLAPLFDHNMALISRGYPSEKVRKDLLITLFADALKAYPEYREYIPAVTKDDITEALRKTAMKVNESFITNYLLARYAAITSSIG